MIGHQCILEALQFLQRRHVFLINDQTGRRVPDLLGIA
jgi:hypothetical protein